MQEVWPTEGTQSSEGSDATEPPLLEFVPCPSDEFEASVDGPASAALSFEHVEHSPCCSTAKLRQVLDFQPQWSSLQAIADAVSWMVDNNCLHTIDFPGKRVLPELVLDADF